MLANV